MTYAGLKSMIFAGVKADDPRVKGAVKWIKAHYTLSANPGMGFSGSGTKTEDGLYYYYHTFAKALSALGLHDLEDDNGVKHDWRHDVLAALAARNTPTAPGSIRMDSSGKGTRTWSRPTPYWRSPMPNRGSDR